jgi:streptogramin lyase
MDAVNISPAVWIDNRSSADSRGRLAAGSFQGHSGHIDGKPSDARFKRPTGVAVDDMGNVYVADTANLAIRKIGESGDR